jgi:D-glycero-D-manno-heptose 1,7-bisphosphate phosphatase
MSRRAVSRPRQAVILAGGRGERLRPYTDVTPKHMLPFGGRPFLSYLLEQLAESGFERVLLLLGYLPDATIDYCGDGRRWGLRIDYSITPARWQTAPRLKQAYPQLDPLFLLHYCDNYWPMQWSRMWRNYLEHGAQAQMTVYGNTDGYSRDNVRIDARGMIDRYDKSRLVPGLGGVDIGYLLLRREMIGEMAAVDAPFEQVLYPELCRRRMLAAFRTGHRYYGVGSLERYRKSEAFFAGQRAVLVDRDGVLNRRAAVGDYITS